MGAALSARDHARSARIAIRERSQAWWERRVDLRVASWLNSHAGIPVMVVPRDVGEPNPTLS